jgi:hypothetical protein
LNIDGPDAEVLQHVHDEGIILGEEAEQQVLGSDVLMIAPMRFIARLDQGTAYPGGEVVPGQKSLLVVGGKFLLPRRDSKSAPDE